MFPPLCDCGSAPVSRIGPLVLFSSSRSPAVNLAFEEYLLSQSVPDGGILILYENDPAIILGRYQNPWRECVPGRARELGVPVLRRVSGGGTVVHGRGNLNFSVITASPPDASANLSRIIRALAGLGIEARLTDKNDLIVRTDADRKVSGSAFRRTSKASMHHGTLLVNSDLGRIRSLLRRGGRDMDARGVPSRPSPMANLAELCPELTIGDVLRAVAREWSGADTVESVDPTEYADEAVFSEALFRLGTWEWNFGKTPEFTERFSGLEGYSGGILALRVRGGVINEAPRNALFLVGTDYRGPEIVRAAGSGAPGWVRELAVRIDGD